MKSRQLSRYLICLSSLFIALSGCNSNDYLYYQDPKPKTETASQKVVDLGVTGLDIVWQIGGMTELEGKVKGGAQTFMSHLSGKSGVNWRIGVISNESSDDPFLGFSTPFDYRSSDPVPTFVTAVDSIVSSGGHDGEKTMDPVVKVLTNFPNFVRSISYLVLIVSNDNNDESNIQVADFLAYLKSIKGDLSRVIIYGVLGASDFAGCHYILT
jgi:hypothetical protein